MTCGSFALVDSVYPTDASVVTRLRDAGMIVLAKSNLSVSLRACDSKPFLILVQEWGNMKGAGSTSGWSAYGGQVRLISGIINEH